MTTAPSWSRLRTGPSEPPAPASGQRGFALLLIFFMAAAVALMLYTQMPRVAFESERDKEQLLIDRGEQYKRAILLYYNDYKRYPAKIEDLENTNSHRYLRRKYVDPFTGKDEWRLVHTNGMFLTDSLVQKPPANPANSPNGSSQGQTALASGSGPGGLGSTPGASPGVFGANPGGFGASAASSAPVNPNDPNSPPQVNAAVLARPSDRPLTPPGGFSGSFPAASNVNSQVNTGYIDPASYPPITLFPNGYNASMGTQPGVVQPGGFQPGIGQQTGQFQPGALQGQFQPGTLPSQIQAGQFQPGAVSGQFQPGTLPSQFQSGQFQPTTNFNTPGALNTQQSGANQLTPFGAQTLPPGVTLPGASAGIGQTTPAQQRANVPFDPNNPNSGLNASSALNNLNNGANSPPNGAISPVNPIQPNPTNTTQSGFAGNFAAPLLNPQNSGGNTAPTSQAVNLINNILTTPRQLPSAVAGNNNNQPVGGGIAGVASTFTGPTIKSYLDHTQYEEWEFIFQPQQQQAVPGQGANPLGATTGNGNNSNSPAATPGSNPTQPGTTAAPPAGLPGLPALPGQPPPSPTGFPQQ
jgi:hypothetical protein